MLQVSSIGAASPLAHNIPNPASDTARFYIPTELKTNHASSLGAAASTNEAENIETMIAEQLSETVALLQESTLSANDRHIALFNAIVQDRGQFPPGTFHIKTDLPGGASIETEIPAIGIEASSLQSVPVISTSKIFSA